MKMGATTRVVGTVAVAIAAVAALGLLAACGGSGEPTSTPSTIAITPVAQSGTTVDANVGDTVVVSLDANPTTGYTWEFTAGDTFTIESSTYTPAPAPSNVVGSGGTQIVTLKVTKAGQSDLTGTYRQQWETPSPDAGPDFTMTIVSK